MPRQNWITESPTISVLRNRTGSSSGTVTTEMHIQLQANHPDCNLYFTTDSSLPDVTKSDIGKRSSTYRYKGPFKLRPGRRTVRSIAIAGRTALESAVATRVFDVHETKKFMRNSSSQISVLEEETGSILSTDIDISSDVDSFLAPSSYTSPTHHSAPVTHGRSSFSNVSTAREQSPSHLNNYRSNAASRRHNGAGDDLTSYFDGRISRNIYNNHHHNKDNVYCSDDSDLETEVSNFFRHSQRLESSHHGHGERMSNGYTNNSPGAFTEITGGSPLAASEATFTIREPRHSHFTSARVRFQDDICLDPVTAPTETYAVPRHTTETYAVPQHTTETYAVPQHTKETYAAPQHTRETYAAPQHTRDTYTAPRHTIDYKGDSSSPIYSSGSKKVDEGRHTPLSDIGYQLGYDYGSGQLAPQTTRNLDSDSSFLSDFESEITPRPIPTHPEVISDKSHYAKDSSKIKHTKESTPSKGMGDVTDQKKSKKKNVDEKKEKSTKNKENKSKKKNIRSSRSSSSSSSSDSSSSDASSKSEKECKKKKKKQKDKEKRKENKEKTKGKDNKKKTQQENTVERSDAADFRPVFSDRSHNKLRDSDSAPHFFNDSGTQINFWGVKQEDMTRQVTSAAIASLPRTRQIGSHSRSSHASLEDVDNPTVSDIYDPIVQPVNVSSSSAFKAPAPSDAAAPSSVITRSQQQEQQSIGGFFRKMFKGWGSDDKEDEDPRQTIRDTGRDDSSKLSYENIVKSCTKDGCLWEDPDFPAENSSLGDSAAKGIEWKRPKEFCDNPEMFVGGASRFDIKQGTLGNCWLLAAVASLTTNKKLLHNVVPRNQSFKENYAGVFCFRFWVYGHWSEVCVDDRLPTKNGKLVYMHSVSHNEFWSPLLEKAYAKLNGSYDSLAGGLASEAMTDFTGGVVERYNFREELPDNLFALMLKATDRGSLMGCSIDASAGQIEDELENGLIIGHAYSITSVVMVDSEDGPVKLVRIRNPWGNECEWKGAWSDQSDEWQSLSDGAKQSLGLSFDHDGEFWMSFRDFSTHFQRLEICHLGPDALAESDSKTHWQCQLLNGSWKKKVNAGGCRNYKDTFWTNPQYRVNITDVDDDDEEDIGTILISVMQKDRRQLKKLGQGNWTIGYEVYKLTQNANGTLDKHFIQRNRAVATSAYINMREVCGRHRLIPGEYCIMPTTFEPNEEAGFLVRVYSEKESGIDELDEETCMIKPTGSIEAHSAPPSANREEAEKQFVHYSGGDQQIDAYELRNILNDVFKKEMEGATFDLSLCRSLVAMTDFDQTGTLGLKEFQNLWDNLQSWKEIYTKFDKDNNGYFSSHELREALKHANYGLSNGTFNSMVVRYSNRDGLVQFEDFVACIVKLKILFDVYQQKLEDGKPSVFTMDEFIQMVSAS